VEGADVSTNAPKPPVAFTRPTVSPSSAPPPKQSEAPCAKCKEHRQKIEDLEGALAGAHNTIRQLRDRDSVVKEEK
jgi:hypothetical protein